MAFDSVFVLFTDPLIADRAFTDGWIYFGWGALLLLVSHPMRTHYPVIIGALTYLAIFIFAIPGEPQHGWYRFPMFPFLSIATAIFIKEHMFINPIPMGILYTMTGLSMLGNSWGKSYGFSYPIHRIFILVLALSMISVVFPKMKGNMLDKWVGYILIISILILTVLSSYIYTEQ
jgi:hypothetical protein